MPQLPPTSDLTAPDAFEAARFYKVGGKRPNACDQVQHLVACMNTRLVLYAQASNMLVPDHMHAADGVALLILVFCPCCTVRAAVPFWCRLAFDLV